MSRSCRSFNVNKALNFYSSRYETAGLPVSRNNLDRRGRICSAGSAPTIAQSSDNVSWYVPTFSSAAFEKHVVCTVDSDMTLPACRAQQRLWDPGVEREAGVTGHSGQRCAALPCYRSAPAAIALLPLLSQVWQHRCFKSAYPSVSALLKSSSGINMVTKS